MHQLSESKDQLNDAMRRLASVWNQSAEVWNDDTRDTFEKEYWAEFETTTKASTDKLQEVIDTIAQAEREIP